MFLRTCLEQSRSVPAYAGHLPDGSSIQKHSAGSGYPYIVQVREAVDLGLGYAEVIDSMQRVLFIRPFLLERRDHRLAAYGAAIEKADALAEARRGGVPCAA